MASAYYIAPNGEIIEPLVDESGAEIPIDQRYHPDFVAELTVYDPANPPEPPAPPSPTSDEVRAQRDALLNASDWTQLPDVAEATRSTWAPYRQALRDVPEQSGFPEAVEWPERPA